MALRNESISAMRASPEDFQFVVQDVLEEYREAQPEFADMQAPIDKVGAEFFLNIRFFFEFHASDFEFNSDLSGLA